MNYRILLFVLFLLPTIGAVAQTTPAGLQLDDDAYQQAPLIDTNLLRGSKKLPFTVSLRAHCPAAGDQGDTESCVGWALAHALTIERAQRARISDAKTINGMLHSAYFIYNQIRLGAGCRAKACLNHGLELLKKQGACLAGDFNNCTAAPTDKHRQKAARYTIQGFERLFDASPPADKKDESEWANRRIDAIRTVLALKQPVLIALMVPDDLKYHPLSTLDWSNASEGHALVVTGYDDFKNEFEILNSYGPHWGEGGFFRLGYGTLAKQVRYAYRMVLTGETASGK